MTAAPDLEHRITNYCATEAPPRAPAWVLESALSTTELTRQRRGFVRAPWRFPIVNSYARMAIAAVAVIAIGAFGIWIAGPRMPPSEAVSTSPDRSALPAASPSPAASHSVLRAEERPDARIDQDWPAPVRTEPAGGAPVVTMALADDAAWDSDRAMWDSYGYRDPVGDVAGEGVAWVDITEVKLGTGHLSTFGLELVGDVPHPQADPADRWIAFGVVQDANRDGVADVRIGIDNLPIGEHRTWRTDLASGRTKSEVMPDDGYRTYYPGEGESRNRAALGHRLTFDELVRPFPFYAWASVIEDGRVVATDYAPDTEWLEEGAQPEVRRELEGATWTTEFELTGEGGVFSVIHELVITADGKISFDTGCNTREGNVTIEPDKVRVSDLVSIEHACTDEMAGADAKTMAVLGAGEINYYLNGDALLLSVGEHALRFETDFGP